jgi:hypothetical protein
MLPLGTCLRTSEQETLSREDLAQVVNLLWSTIWQCHSQELTSVKARKRALRPWRIRGERDSGVPWFELRCLTLNQGSIDQNSKEEKQKAIVDEHPDLETRAAAGGTTRGAAPRTRSFSGAQLGLESLS